MVAVAVVGSAVIGAAATSSAAKKGAKAQQRSADASIDEQARQYDQTREDYAPWRQAGVNALARIQDPNAYANDSAYQNIQAIGTRGLERTAAARGGAFSGNALRALQGFNTNTYNTWFNQQAGIAGVGQNATNATSMAGQNAANNNSNALMAAGDARASGIAGQANAWSNLSGTLGDYAMYRYGGRGGNGSGKNSLAGGWGGRNANQALADAGFGTTWRPPAIQY